MSSDIPPLDAIISLPFEGRVLSIAVAEIHPEIRAWGIPFEIDPAVLWDLSVATDFVQISSLIWMLDLPYWPTDKCLFRVSPQQVLSDPASSLYHYNKIVTADLKWPIEIVFHAGRWLVLDGLHRLSRAVSLGHQTIAARRHCLAVVRARAWRPPLLPSLSGDEEERHDQHI